MAVETQVADADPDAAGSPSPSGTNAGAAYQPYVPASTELKELTVGGIVLGMLLGVLFAASSVYLGLKIGLTVSASIPIAVLSITIFRYISKAFGSQPATILQNNMVQTTGSAGESIAAGTVFTLPALLLLGYALPWSRVAAVAVVGGVLGVLLMIPLRRSLIVDEHANLKYPEGTACAQVLIAGERGGVQARTIFAGFGLGVLYKFLNNGVHVWIDVARKAFERAAPSGAAGGGGGAGRSCSGRSRPRSVRSCAASATSSDRESPGICSPADSSRSSS